MISSIVIFVIAVICLVNAVLTIRYIRKSMKNESMHTTRKKFDDIVAAINDINEEIMRITNVNRDVTKDFTSINDLVSSLSAASEENAASSEEIAATTENVRMGISDVNTSSQEVNDPDDGPQGLIETDESVDNCGDFLPC